MTGSLAKTSSYSSGIDFGGLGEALAVGEVFAVIDDGGGESGQGGDLRDALRDVAGAKDERAGHGQDRLDEDIQLAAADQAVVVGRILPQIEAEMPGLFRLDHLARGVPHFGFHASAADGADHGTIFAHQQLGALVAGDGSAHLDDGGDGALLAELAEAQDFLVDIHSSAIIARGGRIPG